jgi:hypothetical protein
MSVESRHGVHDNLRTVPRSGGRDVIAVEWGMTSGRDHAVARGEAG